MALEKEFATFKRELPELLRTMRGKFVLIHDGDVDSSWDTEDAAYAAGCERFGLDPFLVMLVDEQETPVAFRQDIVAYAGDSKGA
jgi:hypothetical protein